MKFSYFIARKVARAGGKSFSRMIIRIAITAVALSMMVMVVASSLITGFKEEISEKIFGFWGHIHITDPSSSRSLTEVYPVSINQTFYPSLEDVSEVSYISREKVMGDFVEEEKFTEGGIRHIQTYAIYSGIIIVNEEIEDVKTKRTSKDSD